MSPSSSYKFHYISLVTFIMCYVCSRYNLPLIHSRIVLHIILCLVKGFFSMQRRNVQAKGKKKWMIYFWFIFKRRSDFLGIGKFFKILKEVFFLRNLEVNPDQENILNFDPLINKKKTLPHLCTVVLINPKHSTWFTNQSFYFS